MTGHVMDGLLTLAFTREEFTAWVKSTVKPQMQWHPKGWVRHHTLTMVWPGFTPKGEKITGAQRIKNMSVDWTSRGMTKAPHFLIAPDDLIYVMWPPWLAGQHAQGVNDIYWGIEHVGDFNMQPFPAGMLQNSLHVISTLSEAFGISVTTQSLHDHHEFSQKLCPGKNMGSIASWIAEINKSKPVQSSIPHKHLLPVPEIAITGIKREEAFRAKAYDDRGHPAIGYGRRDGYRGFSLTLGMVVTEAQAEVWLREDAAVLADTIQQMLTRDVTSAQLAALVICAYNIGGNALSTSSMIAKLNSGDVAGAAESFLLWNKSTNPVTHVKEVLPGLTKRRERERQVFLGGNPYTPVVVPAQPAQPPRPLPPVVVIKPTPAPATPPAPLPKPVLVPSKPVPPTPVPPASLWVRFLLWLLFKFSKPAT